MADLTDPTKYRIVLALAQFESPTDIMKALAAEGIETDPKQIGRYDPTRPYFDAGEKWVPIFTEAREKFLTEVQAVPIANQGYRMQMLQKTLEGAIKTGNRVLANATLEQAAKEVGGALTNERNVKVSRPIEELTADERREAMVELVRKALEEVAPIPEGAQAAPARTQ